MTTVETSRLTLRPLELGDAAGLHTCYGDPEAMRFWDLPTSVDLEETTKRLGESLAVDPQWYAGWAVCLKETGAFIGFVNYHARVPRQRRLSIGYIIARAYWGRGLVLEAMRPLLHHCVQRLDAHRIEALIEPENDRSIKVAERLGFRREGLLRDRLYVSSQWRDVLLYALLASDEGVPR